MGVMEGVSEKDAVELAEAVAEGDAVRDAVAELLEVDVAVVQGTSQHAPARVTKQGTSSRVPSALTRTHASSSSSLGAPLLGSSRPHRADPGPAINSSSEKGAALYGEGPQPQPSDALRWAGSIEVATRPTQIPKPSSDTREPATFMPHRERTTNWPSAAERTRAGKALGDSAEQIDEASLCVIPPLA